METSQVRNALDILARGQEEEERNCGYEYSIGSSFGKIASPHASLGQASSVRIMGLNAITILISLILYIILFGSSRNTVR